MRGASGSAPAPATDVALGVDQRRPAAVHIVRTGGRDGARLFSLVNWWCCPDWGAQTNLLPEFPRECLCLACQRQEALALDALALAWLLVQ